MAQRRARAAQRQVVRADDRCEKPVATVVGKGRGAIGDRQTHEQVRQRVRCQILRHGGERTGQPRRERQGKE